MVGEKRRHNEYCGVLLIGTQERVCWLMAKIARAKSGIKMFPRQKKEGEEEKTWKRMAEKW